MLRNNNLLPAEYEGEERDRMIADTLRNMIDNGVQVSDDEARHAYNLANEKIGLRYVEFAASDFAAKISPTDAQIAEYYKKYPEQFREPERIKLTYVHYEPLVLAAKYTPPDKDVEDYYKRNASTRFKHPEEVHAAAHPDRGACGRVRQGKGGGEGQGGGRTEAGASEGRLTSRSWRRSIPTIRRTNSRAATSARSDAARWSSRSRTRCSR